MNSIVMLNKKTVITPNENIIASTAEDFKTELLKQIHNYNTPVVELDLSRVSMIDSVGLGVIVSAHRTLCKQKRELVISGVSEDIRQLMATMRLDWLVQMEVEA